jgi:hypothetical protein
MTVAAGLHGNASARMMREVRGHHRGRSAQKCEWARQHALVTNRHQLGDARAISRRENAHRVALGRPAQVSVLFPRGPFPQRNAARIALGRRFERMRKGFQSITSSIH